MLLKVNQQINWEEKKKQQTNIKYVPYFLSFSLINKCDHLIWSNLLMYLVSKLLLFMNNIFLEVLQEMVGLKYSRIGLTIYIYIYSNPNSIIYRFHLLLFGIFTLTLQSKCVNLVTCMPEMALGQSLHNTSAQVDISKYS